MVKQCRAMQMQRTDYSDGSPTAMTLCRQLVTGWGFRKAPMIGEIKRPLAPYDPFIYYYMHL